ncbi:MAG: hypothetical protein EA423_00570, partial [Phycisphaerales bacterium]
FYGIGGVGGPIFTANDPNNPVYSSGLASRNGRIIVPELGSNSGAIMIDTQGNVINDFPPGGPLGVSGFSGLSITADGAIGYRGDFGFNERRLVIDEFDGSNQRVQTLVASTADPDYSFIFTPVLNDARQFGLKVFDGSSNQLVVRFDPGGGVTTIADGTPSGPFNAFANGVSMSQDGRLAYYGRLRSTNQYALYANNGTDEIRIAQPGDLDIISSDFINFGPAINSSGWTAFRARDGVSTALYVGDGQDIVKLVEVDQLMPTDLGDLPAGFDFGGFTGIQVMNGPISINDDGQIGFSMFFRNGTIGVFTATPSPACPADLNGDGVVDADDFFLFLQLFANGDPRADINNDGVIDADDFFAYLGLFAAGC